MLLCSRTPHTGSIVFLDQGRCSVHARIESMAAALVISSAPGEG